MKKILPIILCALAWGCSSGGADFTSGAPVAADTVADFPAHELPVPIVPDSITSPVERTDYVTLHFWDAMDFADSAQLSDTLLMEQTFSNYIYLLPHSSSPEAMRRAIARLAQSACSSPEGFERLGAVVEKYLYDTDSPFCNDALYAVFAEEMLPLCSDPARKTRMQAQLADNKRNPPGSQAPDFSFASTSLYDTLGSGITMLVFHDNDNADAKAALAEMQTDPVIIQRVNEGKLKVMVIDIAAVPADVALPQRWVLARPGVDIHRLYAHRRTPSIYLINSQGIILMKDTSAARASAAL